MTKPVVNEKLMEILDKIMQWNGKGSDGTDLWAVSQEAYYSEKKRRLTQAHDQIIELFRECLPNKKEMDVLDDMGETIGWNDAITEAEKKINNETHK